jgi:hypothetical protein
MSNDEIVFAYSRAEALADGVLVDVSDVAQELGLRYPVALTSAAWERCVSLPAEPEEQCEDGRLWDLLWMLSCAIRRARGRKSDRVDFCVLVRNGGRVAAEVNLKAICGPGDDVQPVITVMLPNES